MIQVTFQILQQAKLKNGTDNHDTAEKVVCVFHGINENDYI